MKLKIAFYDEKISWNKDWIFLGNSFINLQLAERKINGPRIKINEFLSLLTVYQPCPMPPASNQNSVEH